MGEGDQGERDRVQRVARRKAELVQRRHPGPDARIGGERPRSLRPVFQQLVQGQRDRTGRRQVRRREQAGAPVEQRAETDVVVGKIIVVYRGHLR